MNARRRSSVRTPAPRSLTTPSVVAPSFLSRTGSRRNHDNIWHPEFLRELLAEHLARHVPDDPKALRVDFDETRGTVPFMVIDTADRRIGVWPLPFSLNRDPVQIFEGD